MGKLERLEDELRAFVRNTNWMLEEFFRIFLAGDGRTTSKLMPVTGASWKRR